jgi:hypothetical protein
MTPAEFSDALEDYNVVFEANIKAQRHVVYDSMRIQTWFLLLQNNKKLKSSFPTPSHLVKLPDETTGKAQTVEQMKNMLHQIASRFSKNRKKDKKK